MAAMQRVWQAMQDEALLDQSSAAGTWNSSEA